MTETKICPVCGKEFEKHGTQIYCSVKCRRKNEKLRQQSRPKVELKRVCKMCGATFTVSRRHRNYCSDKCAEEFSKFRQKKEYWQNFHDIEIKNLENTDVNIQNLNSLPNPNCQYGNKDCQFCLYFQDCLKEFKYDFN